MLLNTRQTNLLISIGCLGMILIAVFYMQAKLGLHPCPLCITQRIFVASTGLIAFIAFLHNPGKQGVRLYALLGIISAAIGGAVSLRHVWLQNLPDDLVPACGPGLDYMFENFPLQEAIQLLLQGDGNCADVVWTFLGLSIPAWTAVAFAGLIGFNLWQLLRSAD
ncbi:MAG: disulfide bond formation protein B [Candidatus Pelagadaptatus aseana]|uniref:disulfide bond formation protein B n=1 Tax=Candidatus Pelagadaptatus aseana TaxID=3120508 RepID=UPI0039B1A73C